MLRRWPGGLPYPRTTLGGPIPQDTGSQPYQPRPPLIMPTPRAAQIGSVDVIPNLLMTTLAVVAAVTLPPGQQLSASAPQAKYQVQADVYPNQLVLGYNPQPQIQRWDWSAPPLKVPVYVDQPLFHPLTLGMNPQPQVRGLTDSAPQSKAQVQSDTPTNRLPLTVVQNPFIPPDTSQWQGKYQVESDVYPNVLVRGFNPQPQVKGLTDSAPAIKSAIEVDPYPNLQSTTLKPAVAGTPFIPLDTSQTQPKLQQPQVDIPQNVLVLGYPVLYPSFAHFESAPSIPWQASADEFPSLLGTTLKTGVPFLPLDTSQLQTKYQVQADVFERPITLGLNPQPAVQRLDASAPPPKYAVQVEVYPNLSATTLAPAPQPIPLPLGLPVDVSQWQGKFQVQNDAYPNILVLGYPTPPVQTPFIDPWPVHWPMPPVSQAKLKKYLEQQRRSATRRARQIASQVEHDQELREDLERALKRELPIEEVAEKVRGKPYGKREEINWEQVKVIATRLLEKPLKDVEAIKVSQQFIKDPEEDEISELNELHSLYAQDFYERLAALQRLFRKKMN